MAFLKNIALNMALAAVKAVIDAAANYLAKAAHDYVNSKYKAYAAA